MPDQTPLGTRRPSYLLSEGLLKRKEAGLGGQLLCSKVFSGTCFKGQKGTSRGLQAPI